MQDQSSRTAGDMVAIRALSSLAPLKNRILEDPCAAEFLVPPWSKGKLFFRGSFLPSLTYRIATLISDVIARYRGAAKMVALRTRHIDDRLESAYQQGVRQVIILGAGYDTRAYHSPHPDLRFVEIDHPLTQKHKCEVIREVFPDRRPNVEYIAVDFTGDWMNQVLADDCIRDEPSFCIWEGVSYYLPEEAVLYTLDAANKFGPPHSTFIFDVFPRLQADSDVVLRRTYNYAKRRGEPFLWGMRRDDIAEFLKDRGFICSNIRIDEISDVATRLRQQAKLSISNHPVYKCMYLVETEVCGRKGSSGTSE